MCHWESKKARELDWDDVGFRIEAFDGVTSMRATSIRHESLRVVVVGEVVEMYLSPEDYVRVMDGA